MSPKFFKILINFLFLFSSELFAQNPPPPPPPLPPLPADNAFSPGFIYFLDEIPHPLNCKGSEPLEKCLALSLWKYFYIENPIKVHHYLDDANFIKSIIIMFTIYSDGSIGDISFLKKSGIDNLIDLEILRAFTQFSREVEWEPGKFRGKKVNTKMVVPIIINGREDKYRLLHEKLAPKIINACENDPDFWDAHENLSKMAAADELKENDIKDISNLDLNTIIFIKKMMIVNQLPEKSDE